MNTPTCACGSPKWLNLLGESNRERFDITVDGVTQRHAYITRKCNLGELVFIDFTVCINCGRMQGQWPLKEDVKFFTNANEYKTNDEKINEEDILNYEKEKEEVHENKKTVTAGSMQHTCKQLQVAEYDKARHLNIDVICQMLIFSKEGSKPVAVGYLLNGKITPLTDELKRVARCIDLPVSDTHFDEQLKDDSSATKDNKAFSVTPLINELREIATNHSLDISDTYFNNDKESMKESIKGVMNQYINIRSTNDNDINNDINALKELVDRFINTI